MRRIVKLLAVGVAVWLCAEFLDGIHVEAFRHALYAAIVLAIVNVLIKPLLHIVSFPITLLTFGLFCFVINALMIEITDYFISGFTADSFWWALIMSLVLSGVNTILDKILYPEKTKKNKENTMD